MGALHIDGPMLEPLSVVTGLEFQTLDAVHVAAATTELGCIEVRYLWYPFVF